jgi:hypothetical protein
MAMAVTGTHVGLGLREVAVDDGNTSGGGVYTFFLRI